MSQTDNITDKISAMLAQKQMLIASGLAKAMKSYQENPTAGNLRDIKAAEAELAEIATLSGQQPLPAEIPDVLDEESRLIAARDEALQAAKTKPITKVKLKALKKAEQELEKYRTEKETGGKLFASLVDVIAWLDENGWKISKSSAYEHKDEGKIQPNATGKYTLAVVQEYARQYLQRKDGSNPSAGNMQEQKLEAEVRRISYDADMRELKLQERRGELIPKEHVEVELSSRARDLDAHLDAFFRSSAGRIIKMVKGDIQKAPDLITFMRGAKKQMLDNYARPIQGPEEEGQ